MSGDMADFTINDFFDLLDSAASDDGPEAPALVACRACGQGGLSWTQYGESWRLQEPGGKLHPCVSAACRACGATGLHWDRDASSRWRLHVLDGALHRCPVRPLPEEPPGGQAGFLIDLIKRARTVRLQATDSLSLPLVPEALTKLLSDPSDGAAIAARLQYDDDRLESDGLLLLRAARP